MNIDIFTKQSPMSLLKAMETSRDEAFLQSDNMIVGCNYEKNDFHFYKLNFLSKEAENEEDDWFSFMVSGGQCFDSSGIESFFGGTSIEEVISASKDESCNLTGIAFYVVPETDLTLVTEYVLQALFGFPEPDQYWYNPEKKKMIVRDAKEVINNINKLNN
jgi:hypothetical protein